MVERGPEKAGVGGSIPSLATNPFNNLATAKKSEKISRAYNVRTSVAINFTFGLARSSNIQLSRGWLAASSPIAKRYRSHRRTRSMRNSAVRHHLRKRTYISHFFERLTIDFAANRRTGADVVLAACGHFPEG